jgi:hypothetical protein
MARFDNQSGSVLRHNELGLIGPGEFDWPGYDEDLHGSGIPGCVPVGEQPRISKKRRSDAGGGTGDDDQSGNGGEPAADNTGTSDASGASKE